MTSKTRDESGSIIRFGGGVNSRASEDQVDPRECVEGENFVLDPGNGEFKRRDPFDLIGTVPNSVTAAAIVNGGTGYTAGDDLTVVGGTGTAATLNVDTVASGVITGISVLTSGAYTVDPTNPASVTGGTGTGATFNLTLAAAEIRGFATLTKTDGTVSMLVQAGENVFEWDGASTFTSKGTVASTARLRGPIEANWALDDKVIITDLALDEEVHTWDGTTLSEVTFLQSDGSSSFGTFRAKYCIVENERAIFGNIFESSTEFPHLLVSSKRGDFEIISASDRPSSSLSAEDPWFLPTPQLKPINGLASVFGLVAISQSDGAFEKLTGSSAKDFEIKRLFRGSGAVGDEAVVATSNDVIYGSRGKIESLAATDQFGDVEVDDLSFAIRPDVESFKDWDIFYNPRVKRVYCFPDISNQAEIWVLHTDFIGSELSPWSKWTTLHALNFNPTAVMVCRDPSDGLEYTFMGDSSGNLYRLEGSGTSGDGGTSEILAFRKSGLISAELDAKAFHINGWLQHRKKLSNNAELTFDFTGENVHEVAKTIGLSQLSTLNITVYGGDVYYGGDFYYGPSQEDRLVRRVFGIPGMSNQFQVYLGIQGTNEFSVTEIGLRFDTAS